MHVKSKNKDDQDQPTGNEARQEEFLERLADLSNTKKSFELKLATGDGDDHVFIVHEEDDEENNQADMFVDGDNFNFNIEEEEKEDTQITPGIAQSEVTGANKPILDSMAASGKVENPFKNNLFNSEQTPTTQKISVEIHDNYIGSSL